MATEGLVEGRRGRPITVFDLEIASASRRLTAIVLFVRRRVAVGLEPNLSQMDSAGLTVWALDCACVLTLFTGGVVRVGRALVRAGCGRFGI